MGGQLYIFLIWIVSIGTVETLLSESIYDDLTCSGSDKSDVGIDPNAISGDLIGPDNNIAFSYLCENFKYMFKCCGKIKQWKLWAAKTGTIQLQVWRRKSDTVYEMVGENYCQITRTGEAIPCDVDDFDKILVRRGDFVGWHNQGNETIMYKENTRTDSRLENLFRRKNVGDLYPGDTYDWSEVEAYNDRLYALQVIYETSSNPTFTASDMTVPDYINNGATIGRITYEDTDYMDNRSLVVVPYETSTYYTTDIPSGYVSANTAYRPRDDVLKFAMYDLCYKTATASLAVSVQLTSLVIDNLDATFTISETSSSQTLLHTVTVTDPSDQWYCYSDWDTSFPFMLKASSTESYGFYVVEHPGLDYDSIPSYSLPVVCVENKVTSTATVTANIQVGLTKSRPPVITNLYASVTVNAETAFKGDSVFVVTATDPENEAITFTMSCTSNGAVDTDTFRMLKNGDVVLKKFILLSALHQFDCAVTVTDASGDATTNYLHISILNADHAVTITNIPVHQIQLKENTAVGTFIYKFEYADTDRGTYDTKQWSMSIDDHSGTRFFSLDPDTGVLSLAYSEIDAEGADVGVNKVYVIDITVGDVKSDASGTFNIQIINENEAPWFTHDYFTIEAIENSDGTEIESGSLFTFIDDDLKDTANTYEDHFFSLDCDNGTTTHRFYINTDTGAIQYKGDYDLAVAGTPRQVECTITITDKYGLSDTAQLYIYIVNSNSYTPEFDLDQYTFYVAANAPIGTYLGKLSAIDYDSSDDYDNEITYYFDAVGENLTAIDHDGSVYLIKSLETYMGQTVSKSVIASNYDVNVNSHSVTITLIIPSTTTVTTTTTDRNKDFYEDEWSYYWLFLALFGCVLILVAIMFVLFRICRLTRIGPYCYQCCMKGICCRPPPPGVRGFGDKGYDLATFGHRHTYADEDEEIDGWLRTGKDKKLKAPKTDERYGTPNSGYDWSVEARPEPVYEMFRVPSTSTIPKAANYLDPHTSTRNIPRSHSWKTKP